MFLGAGVVCQTLDVRRMGDDAIVQTRRLPCQKPVWSLAHCYDRKGIGTGMMLLAGPSGLYAWGGALWPRHHTGSRTHAAAVPDGVALCMHRPDADAAGPEPPGPSHVARAGHLRLGQPHQRPSRSRRRRDVSAFATRQPT